MTIRFVRGASDGSRFDVGRMGALYSSLRSLRSLNLYKNELIIYDHYPIAP